MLSFRYCAMFLEGGTAEPGSASNLLPGIVSQAADSAGTTLSTLLSPIPTLAEGTSEYGVWEKWERLSSESAPNHLEAGPASSHRHRWCSPSYQHT